MSLINEKQRKTYQQTQNLVHCLIVLFVSKSEYLKFADKIGDRLSGTGPHTTCKSYSVLVWAYITLEHKICK